MGDDIRGFLLRQLDISWALTSYHLEGLSTDECLTRPGVKGLHVHPLSDGTWAADWPESEGYDIGPASIGWLTWHLGFWLSMVINQSFGDRTLAREAVSWPGSGEAARAWITELYEQWRAKIETLTDVDLQSPALSRWPLADRPFGDIVAWANVELMKSAAEIGYARFALAVPGR